MRLLDALYRQALSKTYDLARPAKKPRRRRSASARKRCDARVKQLVYTDDRGKLCTRPMHCRRWALKGRKRCALHGGKSTGPITPEGKAAVAAAMVAGRRAWIAQLKGEGKKIPGGRKRAPSFPTSGARC